MSLDFAALFDQGLAYDAFLETHGNDAQRQRWAAVHAEVLLSDDQRTLLSSFTREMKVLVSAGAWCGDCINQCPLFDHFCSVNEKIQIRFFVRD